MADHYYGVDLGHGADPAAVTTGTSSTASLDVELRVLDGITGMSKAKIILALDTIKAKIVQSDAPA